MLDLWPALPAGLDAAGDVRRVELKVLLEHRGLGHTLDRLGVRRRHITFRRLFFLDTPDGLLFEHGLVARLRVAHGRAELVVKRREQVRAPARAIGPATGEARTELDVTPAGCLHSTSLHWAVDGELLDAVLARRCGACALLGPAQRNLLESHLPGLRYQELELGEPLQSLRAPVASTRLVAEAWWRQGRDPVLELSGKCRPARAVELAGEMSRKLTRSGLVPARVQGMKTDLFLTYPPAWPGGRLEPCG